MKKSLLILLLAGLCACTAQENTQEVGQACKPFLNSPFRLCDEPGAVRIEHTVTDDKDPSYVAKWYNAEGFNLAWGDASRGHYDSEDVENLHECRVYD